MNGVIAVEICVYKHIHTHILSVKSEHYGKFSRKSYTILSTHLIGKGNYLSPFICVKLDIWL